MLSKKFFGLVLIVFYFPFLASLNYLFDDYFSSSQKCLQAFDENYRERCMWGSTETLKNSLNQTSERLRQSLKIYYCGFFRNEGRRILSVNDPFSVDKSGDYVLTVFNGNPLDKRSKAKTLKLSLLMEKTSEKIFDESDFIKQEKKSTKIKLEKGKSYTITPEAIEPIPSYVTLLISDNPIE